MFSWTLNILWVSSYLTKSKEFLMLWFLYGKLENVCSFVLFSCKGYMDVWHRETFCLCFYKHLLAIVLSLCLCYEKTTFLLYYSLNVNNKPHFTLNIKHFFYKNNGVVVERNTWRFCNHLFRYAWMLACITKIGTQYGIIYTENMYMYMVDNSSLTFRPKIKLFPFFSSINNVKVFFSHH
jgi:hypothetical protein